MNKIEEKIEKLLFETAKKSIGKDGYKIENVYSEQAKAIADKFNLESLIRKDKIESVLNKTLVRRKELKKLAKRFKVNSSEQIEAWYINEIECIKNEIFEDK